MYQAIIVANWIVGEKTPAGWTACYNNSEKLVKTIDGFSEEECRRKAKDFLNECQFTALKSGGATRANR